ncbi:MAG TPA: serine/threonine-protein kinase [Gaiellaceae bacterium]|nr:serine/threonine-protein kinase [Gaiellaceae bacterium]
MLRGRNRSTAEEGRPRDAPPPPVTWGLAEGDEVAPGRSAVRHLGGGERYETLLAWDERLLSLVVVKLVRPNLVDDEHSLRGLATEARLLERLEHPVIVRGFGAVLDGPRPHVVLEHLEGPRLSTLIRKQGPLEPEQVLPLGLQLSSALHYLAGEGLVHLDVKPSNIIMGAPARLIDLSIVRTLAELERLGHPIGTDAYMAPEQCDPRGRGPATTAADVWGMGATLYHAATGRRPFPAGRRDGSPAERFPQLAQAPDPLGGPVPSELAALVLACLDPDPTARPTPRALAAELERLVDALPTRPALGRFRIRPRRRDPLGIEAGA